MIDIIKDCWRGEEKLWKVFWLYGVLLSIVVKISVGTLAAINPSIAGIILLSLMILNLPYLIWWLVSIWRCAFNVDVNFWGYLARIFALPGIWGLVVGVIFGVQGLIAEQKCRKEIAPMVAELGISFRAYKQQYPDKLPQECRNPKLIAIDAR